MKRQKTTSIALDLDGTTLQSDGRLSERTRQAIMQALRQGVSVFPASGRPFDSMPEEILGIPGIRYVITSNGTAVIDLQTDTCLRKYTLTEESARRILELTQGQEVVFEAFIDGLAYADARYVDDPEVYGAMPGAVNYIQTTRRPVEDMKDFILTHADKLDCLDLVVREEEHKEALWRLLEEKVEDIYITSSVRQLLEVSYKEAGKESALEFLLEYLHLEREHAAAFGDGDNDRGMLQFAGTGIAVANASRGCLEAADHITLSNDEDGVARGIEWLLQRQD